MKHFKWLVIVGLAIAVTACKGSSDQPVGESGTAQDKSYTEKAKEFGTATVEKFKELYNKTSEKAKEIGAATAEKSKELYDKASEKTKEVVTATVEGSKKLYDKASEKTREVYDKATE